MEQDDPLSVERVKLARQTLTAAFAVRDFPGAVDQPDPCGIFCEAKRNLAAFVWWRYGEEAFDGLMKEEEEED